MSAPRPADMRADLAPSVLPPTGRRRRTALAAVVLVAAVGTGAAIAQGSGDDGEQLEVRNTPAAVAALPDAGADPSGASPSSTEPDRPDVSLGPAPTLVPRHPKQPASSSTTRPKAIVPTTLPVPGPLLTTTPVVTVPPVVVPPLPSPFQRDPTFASGGVFTKDFDKGFDTLSALAVQPDGKLLVGGETITSTNVGDLVILRLTVTGTPDASFGDGGFVRYDAGASEYPSAIVVQPDGKILVAGATGAVRSADQPGGVLRLLPNGTIDRSFADNGVLTTDQGLTKGLVLLPDGKMVVVGSEGDPVRQDDVSLARYTADGRPDTTFGTNGRTLVDTGSTSAKSWWDSAYGLARLDDGSLMVVGQRSTAGTPDCICASALLMRFTANGALDTGFNQTGWRTLDFSSFNSAWTVLPDSGGRAFVGVIVSGADARQAIVRVRPDGSLDSAFGDRGVTRFAAGNLTGLARDPLGRIVASTGGSALELHRFTADGAEDPTFGVYRSDVDPAGNEFPFAVVVLPDGRIVHAGYVYRDMSHPTLTGQYDTDWVVERVALR
jgi:uncharacterized delta-60 repeat protein